MLMSWFFKTEEGVPVSLWEVSGINEQPCARVMLEHPFAGPVLLSQGYGAKGYSWEHGFGIKVLFGDTPDSLQCTMWNSECSILDKALQGGDPQRPLLWWSSEEVRALMGEIFSEKNTKCLTWRNKIQKGLRTSSTKAWLCPICGVRRPAPIDRLAHLTSAHQDSRDRLTSVWIDAVTAAHAAAMAEKENDDE